MLILVKALVLVYTLIELSKALPAGQKFVPEHADQLYKENEEDNRKLKNNKELELESSSLDDLPETMRTLTRRKRMGILDENRRWPEGIIPYEIDESKFSDRDIENVLAAMDTYENKTCIRFRPREEADENYIVVTNSAVGCLSEVGNEKQGAQMLNLQSPRCTYPGVILHELMHAIGFVHQHMSYNRDDFVKIKWNNIDVNQTKNFVKFSDAVVSDFGVGYDYASIMHYRDDEFSVNGNKTIEPKEEGVKIGQKIGLSVKDIEKINKMYKTICEEREKKNSVEETKKIAQTITDEPDEEET